MPRFLFLFAFSLACAFSQSAHAKGPNKKELRQLRTLSELGQEACQSKDYPSCQRAFEQAQEILPWAPHEFYIAEALVGQGKLVEGSALWNQILKRNDPDDCHRSVCQAVRKARQRLNEIEPKIPSVSFEFSQDYEDIIVKWDGTTLTEAELSSGTRVNPGDYQLVVTANGFSTLRETHPLALGESRTVWIELSRLVSKKQDIASGSEAADETPGWPAPLGITLAAAGGLALASGIATWSSKSNKLQTYKDVCMMRACQRSDAEATEIQDLTTLSNTLFFGGGLLLAAGTSVLVWHWGSATEDAEEAAPQTALHVGPLNISVSGVF